MATDAKKIAKGSHDAWNSHDVNRVLEFYTDDCVHEDVPYGIVSHGKKELTTFLNSSFVDFPDIRWELKSLFGAGDWVGKEWVMSGTHAHSRTPGVPATGKTFSVRGATIYQFHNGKISHESAYYNVVTLMQQVGLMPTQPK
jgi:steroid delta-isomerase-like uncharacterized protein